MRRLLTASAAAMALLPVHAMAQDRPTLWDTLSFDRLVQVGLHSAIGLVRTQMDLQYDDLSVDLRRSRVTMTGITAWPFFDWDEFGDCAINIDRIALFTTPIDNVDRIVFKARVSGLSVARECLPEDVHQGLDLVGLETIDVPRLTVDLTYGTPKSDAMMRVYAEVTDVATVDLSTDFAYFWFDGRDDLDSPTPVWFLDSATLAIENNGLWEAVSGLVPPPFLGDDAIPAIEDALTEIMIDMNREGDPDASGLTSEQQAFLQSVTATWPAFLANPEAIVLETGIDGDIFLDFELFEDEPAEVFASLQPRVALAPARTSEVLPAALLRLAMDDSPDLTDEDRLSVGEALITGMGAPRNIQAGIATLTPLAEGGDAAAALLLAEALAIRAPEEAYGWALRAGKAGDAGATAMLDRLEQSMPFARVLELQDGVSGTDSHPGSALRTISGIREQAAMRLSGKGLARSYGIAAMWAMLATAAGDPEAADILEEIDEVVRLEGAEAIAAWAEVESRYAALAMEVWIGQNLPARYAE